MGEQVAEVQRRRMIALAESAPGDSRDADLIWIDRNDLYLSSNVESVEVARALSPFSRLDND